MKKLETGLVRDDAQLIQSLTREVDSIVEESHADGYSFE